MRTAAGADVHALVRNALAFSSLPDDATILADALAADRTGRGAIWQVIVGANLLPFTAHLLDRHHLLDRLEAPQAAFLRAACEVNALRQAVLLRRAASVTRLLATRGIAAAWIKGAWVSACIIEQPGMRYMEDVDVLVRERDFDEARRVLLADGFTCDTPAEFVDAHVPAVSLVRADRLPGSDGALRLDLHYGLAASADRKWEAETFWASAATRHVHGVEVTVPSHAAGLVLAALHAFKHAYDTRHMWTAVADASAILRQAGPALDLDWLDARMRDARVATAVYLLLCLCAAPAPSAAAVVTAALRARATARVEEYGVREAADRILRHSHRLRPIAATDFSLMAIGEQVSLSAAMRRFLSAATRRRRRQAAGHAAARPSAWPGLGRVLGLARTNWRYAYTTFLVGRLAARAGSKASGRRSAR